MRQRDLADFGTDFCGYRSPDREIEEPLNSSGREEEGPMQGHAPVGGTAPTSSGIRA